MTDQHTLFSPHNRRTTTFRCPHCKRDHDVNFPAHWTGTQQLITHCPSWGWGVTITFDATPEPL